MARDIHIQKLNYWHYTTSLPPYPHPISSTPEYTCTTPAIEVVSIYWLMSACLYRLPLKTTSPHKGTRSVQCIVTHFQLMHVTYTCRAERNLLATNIANLMVYYPQWGAPYPPDRILHGEVNKISGNPIK